MRSKITFVLSIFLCLFAFNVNALETEDEFYTNLGWQINPEWEEYMNLSDEEKAYYDNIPIKYYLPNTAKSKGYKITASPKYEVNTVIPSSYDLRNVGGQSYLTPVKDQKNLGNCWIFATNGAIESNILKTGLRSYSNYPVLSESQIDYVTAKATGNNVEGRSDAVDAYTEGYNPYTYYDANSNYYRDLGAGGHIGYAAEAITSGIGEAKMEGAFKNYINYHYPLSLKDVYDIDNREFIVTDFTQYYLFTDQKQTWMENIKKHIMEYGAVLMGTIAPQRSSSYACFVNANQTSDGMALLNWTSDCDSGTYKYQGFHAMDFVGWDDNYTQSYCAFPNTGYAYVKSGNTSYTETTCTNAGGNWHEVTGAWIIRNSWGSTTSYFHLAYDSKINNYNSAGMVRTIEKDFDNTYNRYGVLSDLGSYNYRTTSFAKSSMNEKLVRVSFFVASYLDLEYSAYLVTPTEEIYLGSTIGKGIGRYSIDVNNVDLPDTSFTIKITSNNTNPSYGITKIYAFTSNTDEFEYASTRLTINNTNMGIVTRTNNIIGGSKLSYIVTDMEGNDVTNLFNFPDKTYTVAGAYEGTATNSNTIPNGLYKVYTLYNDGTYDIPVAVDLLNINTSLEGSGTENNPYLIKSLEDFNYMFVDSFKDKYFKLDNDINITNNANLMSVNNGYNTKFSGVLDGDNHKIIGLSQNDDLTGFFETISGTIKNLHFTNVNVNTNYIGGVLASYLENAYIENISVNGVVKANNNTAIAGGIVGIATNSSINKVLNKAVINGGTSGSIVGYLGENSSISNSYNVGNYLNSRNAMSSFVGYIEQTNNSLNYLVDYADRNFATCNKNEFEYDTDNLTLNNVYYYQSGDCKYFGTKITSDTLKLNSTFENFDTNIWTINNGYPILTDNPYIFTRQVTIDTKITSLFLDDNYKMNYTVDQLGAEIAGYEITSSDDSIVSVNNIGKFTIKKEGIVTISIKTYDNSHRTDSMTLYIFERSPLGSNYREFSSETLISNIQSDNIVIENGDNEYIGTGATITYLVDGNVAKSFTAIVKGDLEGDGMVDAIDLAIMLNEVSGKTELTGDYLKASYMTDDEDVDALDLAYLLNKVAGKPGY